MNPGDKIICTSHLTTLTCGNEYEVIHFRDSYWPYVWIRNERGKKQAYAFKPNFKEKEESK